MGFGGLCRLLSTRSRGRAVGESVIRRRRSVVCISYSSVKLRGILTVGVMRYGFASLHELRRFERGLRKQSTRRGDA